ncbi:hypothetical protein [Streptomyces nanshensis]|uniref:Uncharacterized protein n=1 Tax=Streptomyces nanshensis TaxID=518642 RepID=A0A1E7L9T6_9ACTN|nr:hypothetical protein [Streptomyces nanshensis]OEV13012.1 hypothetical protein AN218_05755 [Streptomyces nanshensis]
MSAFLAEARRDPIVEAAFLLAEEWCEGHVIEDEGAVQRAVRVVDTFGRYTSFPPHYTVAGLVLHDAPDFAPRAEVESRVTSACGPDVLTFIDKLHAEHQVLAEPSEENIQQHLQMLRDVPWLATAALADKIVAFQRVVGLAERAADPGAFWAERPAFTRLMPYFRRLLDTARTYAPADMCADYEALLDRCPTS